MRAIPIRLRLTLWYFAMFATAASLLSTTSWWLLLRSVRASEYHELQERAQDVQELLQQRENGVPQAELEQLFNEVYSRKDDGKWLQVQDQDGHWIYRSKRMVAQNPALAAAAQLPEAGTISRFHQGTREVRVLAYPITVGGRRYAVQTGLAENKTLALLADYRTDLLLLTPAMILLAALGGHWMSRKALHPVWVLAAEAREINDRNLDRRLPVPPAEDEIRHLSTTLNQMLARIDNAFASVRAFTGNASHELRTPISILRTEIEVALQRPREAEDYRRTLRLLHGETVRMTNLVDHLLALARADAGAQTMKFVPLNVAELLGRMQLSWATTMQQAMLDFRVGTDAGGALAGMAAGELTALGDASSVPRLLAILLENAAKYTPPGGCVTLSAGQLGGSIVFKVADTGIGIPEHEQERIFDRFYRGEFGKQCRSDGSGHGAGLGLALARWIAERHGTQLRVESEPGRGSCFHFCLQAVGPAAPLRTAQAAAEPEWV